MEWSIGLVICLVIALLCLCLASMAFSLVRNQRLAQRRVELEERDLYEKGREAAEKRADEGRVASNTRFARILRSAGIAMGPVPCALCLVGAVAVPSVVVATLFESAVLGAAAGTSVLLAACSLVRRCLRRRRELFDTQLARALPQISASVRGALTLERALRVATSHMEDPLKGEFSRVLADVSYGMPLYRALEGMADRTQHTDVRILAAATRISQQRGGSISASLVMISSRVNARLKASRELRTEIASARMAKWFVAAALPALFLLMCVSNADFARFYMNDPLGWSVLGIAGICEVVGLLVSHRITVPGN